MTGMLMATPAGHVGSDETMRAARTFRLDCGHVVKKRSHFLIGPIAGPTVCLGCGGDRLALLVQGIRGVR